MEPKASYENLLTDDSPLTPEKESKYRTALTDLAEESVELKKELDLLKKMVFGQKTEKTKVILADGVQLSLFNEAETEAEITVETAEEGITVAAHKRKAKRTHEEMLKELPHEEVVHEVENRECDKCGAEMKTIGKEFVRDELVYVPAKMFVRRHYTEVVKCPSCGTDESKDTTSNDIESQVISKAKCPTPLIPHSFCSPELLAHVLYSKYVQAVPLNRQEKDFKALGVSLSRATMANWVIYAAKIYASPVWNKMKAELLKENVIHADETVVQVLKEPDKKATTDSRMWVYAASKVSPHQNIIFKYERSRNGDHAVNFLGDYSKYIVCDGYDGYNKLRKATRCGCFSHVRRGFVEALPADKSLHSTSTAAKGVEWCNRLFALEREYDGYDKNGIIIRPPLTREEKQLQRQKRSKPVLDEFFAWLETLNASSGLSLAKAIKYALNEKKYLYNFLEDPDIPIHNNLAEHAIRGFVIGRNNWLFSNSVKGAEASAMFYSLASTAIANGLDAESYFTKLLTSDDPILPW